LLPAESLRISIALLLLPSLKLAVSIGFAAAFISGLTSSVGLGFSEELLSDCFSGLADMDLSELGIEQNNNPRNYKLAWDYAQSTMKLVNESTSILNTKLNTLLGFNGILLRFALDLKGLNINVFGLPCYSCLALKIGVCVFSITSLLFIAWGLKTGRSGITVHVSDLLQRQWYYCDEENTYLYLTKTLRDGIEDLRQYRDKKAGAFDKSLTFLILAAVCLAINIILSSFAIEPKS
jgi:hypothetical protein